jgi:hypothetical protein
MVAIKMGVEAYRQEKTLHWDPGSEVVRESARSMASRSPHSVPPPLTQEQINAMSLDELKGSLSQIGKARTTRDLTPETKERLKHEWDLVMARQRKLAP